MALTAGGLSSAEKAQIEREVRAAFQGLAEAAEALDHDGYLAYFNREQYTSLNNDGTVTHDFATFSKDYLAQIAAVDRYESLTFDRVKVDVIHRDTAILVNEFKAVVFLTHGQRIEAAGGGTQVWARHGDGPWRLVSVSGSPAAP
jgi:ketosteroid isomerase-like protein